MRSWTIKHRSLLPGNREVVESPFPEESKRHADMMLRVMFGGVLGRAGIKVGVQAK